MKKFVIIPLVAAVMSACSSVPRETYDRRTYQDRQERQAAAQTAVDRAPAWMRELPRSNSAVYENGTAISTDMGMAINKAKTMAFGKICMAAGGRVDQQSRVFIADQIDDSSELSELAIRSFCPGVDITGAEMVETKMLAERGRFRAFVLIALPTGDANVLRRAKEQQALRRDTRQRHESVQREMDDNRNLRAQ